MSINVNDKNLGHATAYAYYKAGGGTMTEAEFTEFMADFGTASQTAVEAAQAALASKNAAQTAATTATNKASEATTAAQTATTKAGEASTSASTATSAKDTAVSASQTATTKASEATTAAATATSAATTATTAKDDAVSAKTAAQTAQAGAETAAASVQSSASQIAQNASDINELKEDLNNIVTIPNNVNLFDKTNLDTYTIGEAIDINTGSTETYANMCTTDYIVIKRDVQYSFLGAVAYYGTSNVIKIPVYKEDHTFLAWCWGTLDSSTNVVAFTISNSIVSTETGIIRLSFRKADIDSFMFVEGEYPSEYVPYEHPTLNPNIEITRIKSLNGKSISLNGDSICAGGGDAVGGYGLIISENENMVCQNIAVAGGTIAYVSGRHCIARTMQNMYHYNYVIFEGGINDKALNVPFGEVTDGYTATLDDTTFCGAFEQCCKTLVEQYATSKYGYIFVHRIAVASEFYSQWRPAMKTILEKWGIPYLDLQDIVPPLNFIDSLKETYTNSGDGWHPNKLGYETFYVSKITAWLLTL